MVILRKLFTHNINAKIFTQKGATTNNSITLKENGVLKMIRKQKLKQSLNKYINIYKYIYKYINIFWRASGKQSFFPIANLNF